MCSFGGGGGGFGGGGGGFGGGGSFAGSSFGLPMSSSLGFGGGDGITLNNAAPMNTVTNPVDPNIDEESKKYLGQAPKYSEEKLQALANTAGTSSLTIG